MVLVPRGEELYINETNKENIEFSQSFTVLRIIPLPLGQRF